jgi:hypothetical protein
MWHPPQPTLTNWLEPCTVVLVGATGVGAASRRIKAAKLTTSEEKSDDDIGIIWYFGKSRLPSPLRDFRRLLRLWFAADTPHQGGRDLRARGCRSRGGLDGWIESAS